MDVDHPENVDCRGHEILFEIDSIPPGQRVLRGGVRVAGFEPATSCSQNRYASQAALYPGSG